MAFIHNGTNGNDRIWGLDFDDEWKGIEAFRTFAGDDAIMLRGGDDRASGTNIVNAGTGDDVVYGGWGFDRVELGIGSDLFVAYDDGRSTRRDVDIISPFGPDGQSAPGHKDWIYLSTKGARSVIDVTGDNPQLDEGLGEEGKWWREADVFVWNEDVDRGRIDVNDPDDVQVKQWYWEEYDDGNDRNGQQYALDHAIITDEDGGVTLRVHFQNPNESKGLNTD